MNKNINKKDTKNKSIFLKLDSLIHHLKTGLLAMKSQLEQDAVFALKL